MSEAREKRYSPFVKQCFLTLSISLNSVGHGCILGYPAVLLPQLLGPRSDIPLTAETASWIAAVSGPAQLVGNCFTTPIMSRYGRKATFYAVTLAALVGLFVMIMANSFGVLLGSRAMQIMAFGMFQPLRSVMIGEYTSPDNRGALLPTISLSQGFGIFFIHLVGSLVSWQRSALVVTFFFFISAIVLVYCPESPSFLASRGRYEECREAFRWLRADSEEQELVDMIEACELLERHNLHNVGRRRTLKDVLAIIKKREFHRPILVMTHAYFLAQFGGGASMANYPTVIIGEAMGEGTNLNLWMVALDTQRLVSNVIAIFIINKVKRRTMLFSTGALSVFSHLAIAGYVYLKSHDMLYYDAAWVPILLLNLQVLAVATGMVPIPSVIAGEVFPLEYRGIGGSVSLVVLSVAVFVNLKTFPPMIESVGLQGTYTVYAFILFYSLVVIWFLLPETKGKTLQQIEDEFRGHPLKLEEARALSANVDPRIRRESERKASVASLMHSTMTLS